MIPPLTTALSSRSYVVGGTFTGYSPAQKRRSRRTGSSKWVIRSAAEST